MSVTDKNKTLNISTRSEEVNASFLIRTWNEEKYFEKTLDAVLSQSYNSFEVIVVDSGSTDKTLEIAKKYPVKIFKINPGDFTYGFSLNYGFQKTKGKYVICLSAHALPKSKDWLKSIISNFNDEKVAAVMCKTIPWTDCNPFDRRGLLKKYNDLKREITEGPPFIFSNSSSAIRKDIWRQIHFNETLSGSEDYDWIKKVRKLKYKVIYEPKAEVYHSHNETLKQIYRRFYRESYALRLLRCEKYSLFNLFFDLVAGSIYDMLYVIFKRDNLRWLFFAPLRRLAMNYGRFKSKLEDLPSKKMEEGDNCKSNS